MYKAHYYSSVSFLRFTGSIYSNCTVLSTFSRVAFWTILNHIFYVCTAVMSKRFRETQEATVKHSKRTVKITDGSSNNWRAGEETTSAVNCSGTKQTLILSQTHSHGLHTSFLSCLMIKSKLYNGLIILWTPKSYRRRNFVSVTNAVSHKFRQWLYGKL